MINYEKEALLEAYDEFKIKAMRYSGYANTVPQRWGDTAKLYIGYADAIQALIKERYGE